MNDIPTDWSWIRRINHAVLALAVIFQVAFSEWMTKPWKSGPADSPGRLLFTLHEWAGLIAAIAAAIIAWRLFRQDKLPRINAAGRAAALAQCHALANGLRALRLLSPEQVSGLARMVQAAGLLLTAWFCTTGAAIWLAGDATQTARQIGGFHELAVPLLYAYLGGHVGMALLHRAFDRRN